MQSSFSRVILGRAFRETISGLTPVTEGLTMRPSRAEASRRGHSRGKMLGLARLGIFKEEKGGQGSWRHVPVLLKTQKELGHQRAVRPGWGLGMSSSRRHGRPHNLSTSSSRGVGRQARVFALQIKSR